jgi:tetratricopeptide (TPR) repeat protein
MIRLPQLALAVWRSVTEAWTDRNKEQEVDCPITDTKAIKSNPNDATAYLDRGTAHLKASEFDSAIADFTKAIELNPKLALAYSNLGWTYEAIGDEREAIAHYRKALEFQPSLEAARDNLKLLGATPERQPFYRQTKPRN